MKTTCYYMMMYFATTSLLLLPSDGIACGQCVDSIIQPFVPFALWFIPLIFFWLIAATVVKLVWRRQIVPLSPTIPKRKTLYIFLFLNTAGIIVLAMLSMGSVFFPAIVVGIVWVVYIAIAGLKIKRARSMASVEKWFVALDIVCLVLLISLGIIEVVRDHSVATMITRMSKSGPTRNTYVDRILRQPETVDVPLIEALGKAINPTVTEHNWRSYREIRPLAYCLGQIGTPKAEEYLRSVVQQITVNTNNYTTDWPKWICGAYAQCAGERAFNDFSDLFKRWQDGATRQQWIVLAAMVKTASWPGVNFALDHIDILLNRTAEGGSGADRQIAFVTIRRLFDKSGRKALRDLPMFREEFGSTLYGEKDPFTWTTDLPWGKEKILPEIWQTNAVNIRAYWSRELREN